ncbi:MAG TPA: selenide, water dikinase SelD [Actinomycetota bacterium]|jgi:selenide,water dikinase|nr:selenide, water dikinase SelD [Actinomycetota bacterium]
MADTAARLKLTSYSHGAGCACKLGLSDLDRVLELLGPPAQQSDVPADVLVGLNEADDAAVVRLSDDESIVLTLDFFTPLVDDPFIWGQIAATNAASDVYAMGGRPLVGLNIAAWPREALPLDVLADVLRGGRDVAERAGFVVVGGHTVDDPEPKYGMVIVGHIDPSRMMTIDAARPGDDLVLTKPIGTGVITTAIKADKAPDDAMQAAVESMTRLNDVASAALVVAGVRACTDVTGFGLLGHLHRMLAASGAAAAIDAARVPLLPGAPALAESGSVPGGTKRNLAAVDAHVTWDGSTELTRLMLADAQTSGGLLAACPADRAVDVGTVIGRVVDGPAGTISVSGNVG